MRPASLLSLRGIQPVVMAVCALTFTCGPAFAQDAPISANGAASWSAPTTPVPAAATVVHSTNAGLKIETPPPAPAPASPMPTVPARTYAAAPRAHSAQVAGATAETLPHPTTPVPPPPMVAKAATSRSAEAVPVADPPPRSAPVLATASAPAAPRGYVLQRGETLSHALEGYVASLGWTLRWNIHDDYVLDAPFPIPPGDDVIHGVTYVVRAYQSQGGLLSATPMFAMPNHVVVIEDSHAPRGN